MSKVNRSLALRNVNPVVPTTGTPAQLEGELGKEKMKKIIVRSHTKVIYYFPTILAALVCGFHAAPDGSHSWAGAFLTLFFLNTVVVLFDFNSLRTLFLTLVSAVIGLVVWHFGWLSSIFSSLAMLDVKMNHHTYYTFAVFFGLLLIGDFVWSHLNRWEFSANEVKHIQAFAGHTANFPGRGLRFQVRTVDVFERLILGAGTLVLLVGKKRIKLHNVILAHHKVKELEKFIRSTGVFSDDEDVFIDDDDDDDDDD